MPRRQRFSRCRTKTVRVPCCGAGMPSHAAHAAHGAGGAPRERIRQVCSFDISAATLTAVEQNGFIHRAVRAGRFTPSEFEYAFPHAPARPTALILPETLLTFLASVDSTELSGAMRVLVDDAGDAAEAPAHHTPAPPTRVSYALDNVLFNLAERHHADSDQFWSIPIHASFSDLHDEHEL